MLVPQPFTRFESHPVADLSVPTGIPGLATVLAIGLVVFVVMLVASTGITHICPAPRAGTPVHLAR